MILVTGGTGFIGAHLLHVLLDRGNTIRAIHRKKSSFHIIERVFSFYKRKPSDIKKKIEWIGADITDIYSLEACFNGVSQVYHAAAIVSFQPADREKMMRVNIHGTANMVNMALEKQINKFCHVSSIAAIGRGENDKVIDENVVWKASKNNSNYAISKYGAEQEVWRGIAEGLSAIIVNPGIVLGPGEINSGSTKLIKTVENGLKFYTPGINGVVDVRDVVEIMVKLMQSEIGGERFVLTSENINYQTLFSYIAAQLHKPAPPYKATKWMGELAWRAEYLKSLLTGNKPLITKETARTAGNEYRYSANKVIDALDFEFRTVQQTITDSCRFYMDSKNI
ncbi:MAG: NAD-dependent epimerase/dehydratase family protein [Bacteroidales bacterium]|nr:NAD-dependent epimerase/dehydratase family protein [Bacteroidales bacterium]MCF8403548.1 NAD-dependent epimerase/dehydratase family protein [Bacteroidales bacterium]